MPRGEHREGAGRKPRSVDVHTEKTREIIERTSADILVEFVSLTMGSRAQLEFNQDHSR